MELSDRSLLQVLLCGSDVMALRKILDDLLTDPSSRQKTRLGVAERPLQVGHDSIVGALLPKIVGVLDVQSLVRAACGSKSVAGPDVGSAITDLPRMGAPLPLPSNG
jgi:hypothetical protein